VLLLLEVVAADKAVTDHEGNTSMVWLLVGALFLLAMLSIFLPIVFKWLKLTDSEQALGLPEGTVRAVIALVLIALFAAAPIYLFNNMSGSERTIPGLSAAEMAQLAANPRVLHPVFIEVKGIGDATSTYTAYYREQPDPAGVDFAKQMLVLLGTLATSVTSFYFGAKIAGSASAQGAAQAGTPPAVKPTLRALTTHPTPLPARVAGAPIAFELQLTGGGLNDVKTIKLASGNDQFTFASKSSDTEAACDVSCTPSVAVGADWDVTVIDGMGTESPPLRGMLKF
jgi:hypothetical protein